jgi:hypothetical protein
MFRNQKFTDNLNNSNICFSFMIATWEDVVEHNFADSELHLLYKSSFT